jgi:hypothetical protein
MTMSLLSVKYPKVHDILVSLGLNKYLLKKNEVQVGGTDQLDRAATGRMDESEQGDNKILPQLVNSPKELEVYDDNKCGSDNPKNSVSEIVIDNQTDNAFYNRTNMDIVPTP